MQSFQRTDAIRAAINLRLFTAIGQAQATAAEIAAHCEASEREIRILCDYLATLGLIRKNADRYSASLDASTFLDQRSAQYAGDALVEAFASGGILSGYGLLADAIRRGGTALPERGTLAHEYPAWPQHARALAAIGAATGALLAKRLKADSTGPVRILDIAAGHGHYGIAFARENPAAQVFAQDWPHVLQVAREQAEKAGVQHRFHLLPGNVFDIDLGGNYDLALIMNFLPDFGPAECETLLWKVRLALRPNGRVISLQWTPEDDRLSPAACAQLALTLLATTPHGDVYTYRELDRMFLRTQFVRSEMLDLPPSLQRVVVAYT